MSDRSETKPPADEGRLDRRVRRVVCAALRAADGRLLLGIRHYSTDMHAQLARRDDRNRFQHLSGDDQGFVDQHGVYMTRREAYDVALQAGQIVNHDACEIGRLYSEALY
jgi:hypothetical protein